MTSDFYSGDSDSESGEAVPVKSWIISQRSCISALSVHNLHRVTYKKNTAEYICYLKSKDLVNTSVLYLSMDTFNSIGDSITRYHLIIVHVSSSCTKQVPIHFNIKIGCFIRSHPQKNREVKVSISTRGHCECSGCTVISVYLSRLMCKTTAVQRRWQEHNENFIFGHFLQTGWTWQCDP